MAQKTIPELNPISALEDNYAFPLDSGIQTYKVFWSTIKEFIWNHVISTFTALTTPAGTDLIGVELGTGVNAGKIRKVTLADLKTFISENAGVPIGGVIGFFDFNGLLSYNPNVFTLIRGQTISDVASPLNGLVLPNVTGRALIGYGTDGGTDQASATWSINPVGNSGHTINTSHVHSLATGFAKIFQHAINGTFGDTVSLAPAFAWHSTLKMRGGVFSGGFDVTSWEGDPSTSRLGGFGLGGNSGAAGTTALDIRMRSIRVRWLLRYK